MSKRKKLTSYQSGRTMLLDGDIIIWRIGATTNEESVEVAAIRMNQYIDEIFHNSFCSDYRIFLTDSSDNFRVKVYPEYKANRPQRKPTHYTFLRDYLIGVEKAEIAWGQEADDLLGIEQTDKTIIATIDKDLDMVSGDHYNFVKDVHYSITNAEGMKKFWMQMLTGDRVDNIPGIRGIGAVKAAKLVEGCTTREDYKQCVLGAYKDLTDIVDVEKHLNMIGKLLWIRREEGEMWEL